MAGARALLVRLRYALPGWAGRLMPAPGTGWAARTCWRLARRGGVATAGYFQANGEPPATIAAAYRDLAGRLAAHPCGAYLSVKAPPLGFDAGLLRDIAAAAATAGTTIVLDAHAPADAERTLACTERLLAAHPGTGCVIPARWRRSAADAARLRETSARIRVVKGEWADPDWPDADVPAAYLSLVGQLAGRAAPVAVATHDPALAEAALALLIARGTPCELEQLRGLPGRRTRAVARRLGVPVRVYLPYGPGWWPYAIDKALARPYLPAWWLRDLIGRLPDQSGLPSLSR